MPDKKRIGDLLVDRGVIDRRTAEVVAAESVATRRRFASVVVRTGRVGEHDALLALSEQLGVPAVDLDCVVIPRAVLDVVPAPVALRQMILPLHVTGTTLLLAMYDPEAHEIIDEVSFATGLRVLPHAALQHQLEAALAGAYGAESAFYEGPEAGGTADGEGFVPVVSSIPAGVELPIAEPEKTRAPPAIRRTILVVDEDPEIVTLLVRALEELGHTIVTANRGLEAMRLIENRHPDLIVLDAMLPEVHGFEISRNVKASPRFGHTAVLMVSAAYRGWSLGDDIRALYGVDAFLEKPFHIAEVREVAERLLASLPAEDEMVTIAHAELEAAERAFADGDPAAAVAALRRAEAVDPFAGQIHLRVARILAKQNMPFDAVYHLERAVRLGPERFAAATELAGTYQELGFTHKAVEMWQTALASAPNDKARARIEAQLARM
jgi:CheY-like chemotaxis protein